MRLLGTSDKEINLFDNAIGIRALSYIEQRSSLTIFNTSLRFRKSSYFGEGSNLEWSPFPDSQIHVKMIKTSWKANVRTKKKHKPLYSIKLTSCFAKEFTKSTRCLALRPKQYSFQTTKESPTLVILRA